jgi:flagellar biosynthesis anti-sigma factor FlgM
MKVDAKNTIKQFDPKLAQSQAAGRQKAVEEVASSQVPRERVSISRQANNIQQVEKELNKIPDVRQDLVNRIKTEVDTGKYERPAKEVAGAALTSSLIESLYH